MKSRKEDPPAERNDKAHEYQDSVLATGCPGYHLGNDCFHMSDSCLTEKKPLGPPDGRSGAPGPLDLARTPQDFCKSASQTSIQLQDANRTVAGSITSSLSLSVAGTSDEADADVGEDTSTPGMCMASKNVAAANK